MYGRHTRPNEGYAIDPTEVFYEDEKDVRVEDKTDVLTETWPNVLCTNLMCITLVLKNAREDRWNKLPTDWAIRTYHIMSL